MNLERHRQQFGPNDAPGWLAIDAHLAQVRKAHWNRPNPSTLVEILEIATGLHAVQAKKVVGMSF